MNALSCGNSCDLSVSQCESLHCGFANHALNFSLANTASNQNCAPLFHSIRFRKHRLGNHFSEHRELLLHDLIEELLNHGTSINETALGNECHGVHYLTWRQVKSSIRLNFPFECSRASANFLRLSGCKAPCTVSKALAVVGSTLV